MRVLHVTSGNLYGGVESMLVTLARYRDACPEMEMHFAVCFQGRLEEELAAHHAPVHLLPPVRVRYPSTVLRSRRAMGELLRRERFDLVVSHSVWPHAIYGPVIRAAGLPLVLEIHGSVTGSHWVEWWARRTAPDLLVCNSHFTAATSAKLHPEVPRKVVYCPVAPAAVEYSPADREALRAELATPSEAVVVVQVGRMEAWKGHALHIKALSRMKHLPGWMCWQVGGAQRPSEIRYYAELQRLAERLGVADRVRFLGQRSDVPRLLAAADIYCQPNTGPEPFGITFVEALFAGLPVVATELGGAQEIVDTDCGILVAPGDVEALAASLSRVVEDGATRTRLGAAGPRRARELCDPSAQIRRFREVFRDVLNGAGKPSLRPTPRSGGGKVSSIGTGG